MLEPWRIGVAVGLFASLLALGIWQLWTTGSVRRFQEYAFLLYTTALAVAYAVVHDQLTVTLSPEYFLYWKGLAGDPRPLRWTATLVAVQSSWWTGLLGGVVLLVANNPRHRGVPPRLPLRRLVRIALLPMVAAALLAAICGVSVAANFLNRDNLLPPLIPERVHAFMVVWSVHIGSYSGAALGTLGCVVLIEMRRRAAKREGPSALRA
jgi:hypothetical protein